MKRKVHIARNVFTESRRPVSLRPAMSNISLTCGFRLVVAAAALNSIGPSFAGEPGKMTREVWSDLSGSRLSAFSNGPRYWKAADKVATFSGAAAPANTGDNYASRVRAIITAPASGNYTFWIASDDDCELRLSTGESKFQRARIASISGWVQPKAWDSKASQKSALIPLVAGQRYFLEAVHKEGDWRRPPCHCVAGSRRGAPIDSRIRAGVFYRGSKRHRQ